MLRIIDELVPVFIVLQTPLVDESTLNSYLTRLAISLESFALSTAPNPESGDNSAHTPKELIFAETIQESHEPFLVHRGGTKSHVYIIWKLDVFICKPLKACHAPVL